MKTYYTLAQAGFIAVTAIYLTWFVLTIRRAVSVSDLSTEKKTWIVPSIVAILVAWLALIGFLAAQQVFNDFSVLPPRFFIVVIIPLILILWATSTRSAREIAYHIPPQTLLYMQSFRIFVEVLLWMLFIDSLLPIQMTFEGRNFDILSGLFGPIAAILFLRSRSTKLLWIYNVAGLALLINIVTIAILSTPVPFRVFMNEPANTIVTQFPVVWLPGILVPLAYTLHILSLKQLPYLKEARADERKVVERV